MSEMNEIPSQGTTDPEVGATILNYVTPQQPMSADLAQFLLDTGRASRDFTVREIDGELYTNYASLKRIEKYEPSYPGTVTPFTLDGLCEWLKQDIDGNFVKHGRLMVVVENEVTVSVYPPVCGMERNRRPQLAECKRRIEAFPWGRFQDQEAFIVFLLSRFTEDSQGNRDAVGKLVGNIRQEQSAEAADDGISQRVTVKSSIAKVGETIIKNPVYLAPMRTFCEIPQPVSPFVLRVQEGPQIALFEADAGEWRNAAVRGIRDYLTEMLDGLNVSIIA
ncbi:MAG: hypothetical protein VB104_06965 [Candidatus Limiplasma sp.]|nr:hypothetical protein [Candidatus Limiplasma sp.]